MNMFRKFMLHNGAMIGVICFSPLIILGIIVPLLLDKPNLIIVGMIISALLLPIEEYIIDKYIIGE